MALPKEATVDLPLDDLDKFHFLWCFPKKLLNKATDPNKIITAASFSIFLITHNIKSHIVLWVTQCIQQNDEHLIKIIIIL